MRIIFLLLLSGIATQVNAQESATKKIQRGNDLYKQQQYQQAEAAYKEVAETEPASTTAQFNKANAIYRQDRNSEAIKAFEEVTVKANEVEVKGKAYYNKGVILSGQKRLEESIEAYKNALRQNPADKEARENLQKALLELKQKQPPPPKKEEPKKQQEQKQKQQQQPKMNQKEAQQRLKLLEQKEKDVQQRLQNEKSKQGGGQPNDW